MDRAPSYQTLGTSSGFLNDPGHADALRAGVVMPRRCRHCGAELKATGGGGWVCSSPPNWEQLDDGRWVHAAGDCDRYQILNGATPPGP
jgi:hypothetical protein